jgi:hypothetical protein
VSKIRFFYVRARTSDLVHKAVGSKVEGNRTLCGLTMRPGWLWTTSAEIEKPLTRCQRCE